MVKVKITLKKAFALTLCLAFIVVLCAISFLFEGGKSSVTENSINQVPAQQIQTVDNTSDVSDLNMQITNLKTQVLELERTIAQKENENDNLKDQVRDLQSSLNQIISELDSFEQIEQIRLTVERLRNEP